MHINKDGSVYLETGEIMPFVCVCGTHYPPPEESEWSICPVCEQLNVHGAASWRLHRMSVLEAVWFALCDCWRILLSKFRSLFARPYDLKDL